MKEYAVISGASSGIGREFARLFAHDGVNVVLVARGEAELKELARELETTYGVEAFVYAADLSDISRAVALHGFITEKQLDVTFLVNSAGFGDYGPVVSADWDKLQAMINLNVTALTYLSKAFASDMWQRGGGRIVNLASTAAFLSGPDMAVYYATKAYVLHFSEALAYELKRSRVTVTALCPGPTASGFASSAHAENVAAFKNRRLPTAEQAAAYGYKAMLAGKPVAIHGRLNRLMLFLAQFVPRQLRIKLTRRFQG